MNTYVDVIDNALKQLRERKPVILVDDASRENECDLMIAGSSMTLDIMRFFLRSTSGLICASMDDDVASYFNVTPMLNRNTDNYHTSYGVLIDATDGITTGISSHDRSKTILALSDRKSKPNAICKPGHILTLIAKQGGIFKRRGHTEMSVDLVKIFNSSIPDKERGNNVACISEIVDKNSDPIPTDKISSFSLKYDIPIVAINDVLKYRFKTHDLVYLYSSSDLNTIYGLFRISIFKTYINGYEYPVLCYGDIKDDTYLRIHSECYTAANMFSLHCDCQMQIDSSMKSIVEHGSGIIIFMVDHEGRSIGLGNKIKAYDIQNREGLDTFQANRHIGFENDDRSYGVAYQILRYLNIDSVSLLSSNKYKRDELIEYGIDIKNMIPVNVMSNKYNIKYIQSKQEFYS